MSGPVRREIAVLHVDDEPFVELAAEGLEHAGDELAVTTVTSATAALERLAAKPFDCVVSDYEMPEGDGIEFLQAVRADHPDLPFILFTGRGSESVASEAISAGVTDYLQKGGDDERLELLANRIKHAVAEHDAERRAARVDRRLRELSEVSDDILWMFTGDWSELLFINSAYEEIWGRSTDRLAEHATDFLEGVHPGDRERVRAAMDRLSAGSAVDFEFRVNAAEDYGRWVWVKGEAIEGPGGDVARTAGFARDVTARREREQALRVRNERLDEFASIVSHDLRNPLNVATGELQLAREDCESDHLQAVEDAHDRMQRLIGELLSLAKAGDALDAVEPVDLATTVAGCWRIVDTAAAAIEVELDRVVRADEVRLRQLLENLFRNAVVHGGDDVTVTVGALEDGGGVYVADDGRGIPPSERQAVFESGHSSTTDGTGFGLTIVQDVAEAHGWTVHLTESDAGGARFEFTGVEFVE